MPRSNAKLFPGSTGSKNRYRDREVVTAPDGTKKDIQGYGSTKLEATQDFNRKAAMFIKGHPAGSTITFAQVAEGWLEHKRIHGRKRRTISSYNDVLKNHLTPVLGEQSVVTITRQQLSAIQYALVSEGKYRTAEMAVMILKSLYDYAAKEYREECDIPNVARDLEHIAKPHTDDPKDAIWTHEQIEQFLSTARAEYDNLTSLYYPLYLTSISAGLRRGELLGLRWQDVGRDKDGHYLHIRQQITVDNGELYIETPKTPKSTRRVPLPEPIYDMLQLHREVLKRLETTLPSYKPNELVFPSFKGTPISPHNLRRSYIAQIEKAGSSPAVCVGSTQRFQKWRALHSETIYSVYPKHGLQGAGKGSEGYLTYQGRTWRVTEEQLKPELPPIYFHNLRKCAATYITQALVDAGRYAPKIVAQILGHSKTDVALEIYTKVVNNDLQFAVYNPLQKSLVRDWLGNDDEAKEEGRDAELSRP